MRISDWSSDVCSSDLHHDTLASIQHFTLNGRAASGVGVKADLRWQQFDDGHFEIRIAGPFGAGAVAISGTPDHVEIRTKYGIEHTDDPQAWLFQRAGWSFPIAGLRWWVLGLPAPNAPAQIELDAQGRLAALTQSEERRVGKEGVSTCRYRWSPYH